MLRKLAAIGVFAMALAPSAYLAWTLRAMPHLGFYHDDSIYWVSARSLAEGHGYRIQSLPGEPYQTKYPPLYPVMLAGIWKWHPGFPSNLPMATLFAWLWLPAYLALAWTFFRQVGLGRWEQRGLVLAAGLSPVAVVFSFSLMPELLFTALLLASLILAERAGAPCAARWLPVLAGLCGALAYLTKSSAAPLLLSVPVCFAMRRQLRNAALFLVAMLPAPLAWQWWVSRHLSASWDLVTLYYTNYLGFQLYNVPWRDLPLVAWHNLDGLLTGAGKLLTFDVPYGSVYLERVVAVAAIAGCVRLARRTQKLQYPLAALGFALLMLVWHFIPDQRFVFPLYPILAAGLWTELKNVCRSLQLAWNKPALADRCAAWAGAGVLALLAAFVIFTTIFGLFRFLPGLFEMYRADLEARRPAYVWIARNVPAGASVFAYDDPILFLYTGRKSCSLPVPPKFYYHHDTAGIDALLDSIPDFAREHGLSYAFLTGGDFYRDLHASGAQRLIHAVQSSSAFQLLYSTPIVAVYGFQVAPPDPQRTTRQGTQTARIQQ
ncbi:MAG TPA: hypothetical protein VEV17_09685 [Bryobacteraceae bacterium]|nr:hypothetical protein [Bryobacteraceae bacterium]